MVADIGAPSTVATKRCPDFDLAPLTELPPEVFQRAGHNDVDAFILSLALAYNDLKDINWTVEQLSKCKPTTAVTAEVAQWSGMNIFTNRQTLALLNELLQAIAAHRHLLNGGDLNHAIAQLKGRARNAWESLVAASQDDESDEFRKFLVKVRSNVASHYYQPKALLRAYQGYFFERASDDFNKAAYVSLGDTMEATRFYFVDAAPAWYYQHIQNVELYEEARKYIPMVNTALRWLVEAFLVVRLKRMKTGARGATIDSRNG
jgi:hypothetical protein